MNQRTTPSLLSYAVIPLLLAGACLRAEAVTEYSKHFGALSQLSVAVAEAMPAEKYGFKPHAESMTFGELMSHIASTNYQFCAGLKDLDPPTLPSPTEKTTVVKFLSDSFQYCSGIIENLTEPQLSALHNSPDGRMRAGKFCWPCTSTWRITAVRQRSICVSTASSRRDTGSKRAAQEAGARTEGQRGPYMTGGDNPFFTSGWGPAVEEGRESQRFGPLTVAA